VPKCYFFFITVLAGFRSAAAHREGLFSTA
jgi:hypothetical protein